MCFLTFRDGSRRSVRRIETDRMTRNSLLSHISRRIKTSRRTDRDGSDDWGQKTSFWGVRICDDHCTVLVAIRGRPRIKCNNKGCKIAWLPGTGRTFKKHTFCSQASCFFSQPAPFKILKSVPSLTDHGLKLPSRSLIRILKEARDVAREFDLA